MKGKALAARVAALEEAVIAMAKALEDLTDALGAETPDQFLAAFNAHRERAAEAERARVLR